MNKTTYPSSGAPRFAYFPPGGSGPPFTLGCEGASCLGVCPWWLGRHRNSGAVPFSGLAACVLFYADYANSKSPVTERPVGCCSLALHIPFLFMRDDSFQAIIGAPPPIIVAQDAREPISNLLVAGRHYFIPSLLGIPSPWPILLRSLAPAFSLSF